MLFSAVDGSAPERAGEISVSPGKVNHLVEVWSKTWQRPPTPQELEGLIEEHVKEEVYYREALAMGLDRDDTIVRRRLRQKLEFLMNDLANAVEPTEEELRDYLRDHPDQFRSAPRVSFSQVYLNRDCRGGVALKDAEKLLSVLERQGEKADTASLGDSLLLEKDYNLIQATEVAKLFGGAFAEHVAELPLGRWAGPVESGYGLHLVHVRERVESELPDFENVREAVRREFLFARRQESGEALYQRLRSKYTIVRVEQPPGSSACPVRRMPESWGAGRLFAVTARTVHAGCNRYRGSPQQDRGGPRQPHGADRYHDSRRQDGIQNAGGAG